MPLHAEPKNALQDDPPLFEMSQLRVGMKGVGYTVFSSQKGVEEFHCTILGVMRNFLGTGIDLILVQLDDEKFKTSGVVAGMSGSPVYIDGKLVGALGYGLGTFSDRAIGGIAPIEAMLKTRLQTSSNVNVETPYGSVKPLSLPFIVQGVAPEVVSQFAKRFKQRGLASPVPAGGDVQSKVDSKKRFSPGEPLAITLVSGDMSISGLGTVTWVKENQFLAFGHPMFQVGASEAPVATAEVLTTVFSSLNAFKIGRPGEVIGVLQDDRSPAVAGVLEKAPDLIDLQVEAFGATRHYQVAQLGLDTPMFLGMAISNALVARTDREQSGTLSASIQVKLESGQTAKWSRQVAEENAYLEFPLVFKILDDFTLLLQQPFKGVRFKSVSVQVTRTKEVQISRLQEMSVLGKVTQGSKLTAQITRQIARAANQTKDVELILPLGYRSGRYNVVVADRTTSIRIETESGLLSEPTSFADFLEKFQSLPKDNDTCIYLEAANKGKRINSVAVANIPISLRVLTSNIVVAPQDQLAKSAVRLGCFASPQVVTGQLQGNIEISPKGKGA